MAALEPYRFEPEHVLDVADDDSSDDNEINERLESTFWCSCKKCEVVLTPKEFFCCVVHFIKMLAVVQSVITTNRGQTRKRRKVLQR